MVEQAKNLMASFPADADKFVRDIQTNGESKIGTCNTANLAEALRQYGIEEKIINKFQEIVFGETLRFQTFCMEIEKNTGHIDEFVGAARRVDDKIDFAFVRVHSFGTL